MYICVFDICAFYICTRTYGTRARFTLDIHIRVVIERIDFALISQNQFENTSRRLTAIWHVQWQAWQAESRDMWHKRQRRQ